MIIFSRLTPGRMVQNADKQRPELVLTPLRDKHYRT